MNIPTEPIGSIPRPLWLIEAIAAAGDDEDPRLDPLYDKAIRDTVERFVATGSPVITDGEQRKYHNFWTYSVHAGIGIAPEFIAHVSERFRQADASTARRYGGLGLGFSIVKQLVELHGGTVRATRKCSPPERQTKHWCSSRKTNHMSW